MKDITWQLVRGKGFVSKLIGYQGQGYYSHIDTVTPGGWLRGARSDWILDIAPGCQDRPNNYEEWDRQTRFTVSVTDAQYAAYWAFSNAQMGKPYDSRGLIETYIFGRQWRDDDKWWCSEWVGANGEAASMWTIPPEVKAVDPGDCVFLFAGMGATRTEMG